MEKTIYDLELHETLATAGTEVMRVAGGWIYRYWDYGKKDFFHHATFVPFNEEFKARNPDLEGFCEDKPTQV